MKTIFKVLVILVVAVMLGVAFYGVVSGTSSSTGIEATLQERPSPDNVQFDGGFAPPDREEFEEGVQLPFDMIKNMVIISVVAAIYLNLTKYFGKMKAALQSLPGTALHNRDSTN